MNYYKLKQIGEIENVQFSSNEHIKIKIEFDFYYVLKENVKLKYLDFYNFKRYSKFKIKIEESSNELIFKQKNNLVKYNLNDLTFKICESNKRSNKEKEELAKKHYEKIGFKIITNSESNKINKKKKYDIIIENNNKENELIELKECKNITPVEFNVPDFLRNNIIKNKNISFYIEEKQNQSEIIIKKFDKIICSFVFRKFNKNENTNKYQWSCELNLFLDLKDSKNNVKEYRIVYMKLKGFNKEFDLINYDYKNNIQEDIRKNSQNFFEFIKDNYIKYFNRLIEKHLTYENKNLVSKDILTFIYDKNLLNVS